MGSWILDSGVFDHVVGNPSLIYNLSPPEIPHNITFANGYKEQVIDFGQTSPLPSLSLDYVLFVPSYPFNLISISKLTHSLNCSIKFTSSSLFKQDQSTNTIGASSERQGLYCLQSPSPTVYNVYASLDIIHHRFGYQSLDKLKVLVLQLSYIKSLDCKPCQLGKHVRTLFTTIPIKDPSMPFILCILIFGVIVVCPLI